MLSSTLIFIKNTQQGEYKYEYIHTIKVNAFICKKLLIRLSYATEYLIQWWWWLHIAHVKKNNTSGVLTMIMRLS